MKKHIHCAVALGVAVLTSVVSGQKLPVNAAAVTPAGESWQVFNINNLWSWHRSDGVGNRSPKDRTGGEFPQFTAPTVFEDNLIFGAVLYKDNWPEMGGQRPSVQPIRVNGGQYFGLHGMVRGWVDGTGPGALAHDPNDPATRIFRIRRDYRQADKADLTRDASIVNELPSPFQASDALVDAMVAQYDKDWKEWPVSHGAPYIERNGITGYQPPPDFSPSFKAEDLVSGDYDEPGVAGSNLSLPADQVLYSVSNGLDSTVSVRFSGSMPIGVEIQKTVWGYRRSDALGNVYFVRYRLINKGGVNLGDGSKGSFYLDSAFVSQYSDIDMGNGSDDLKGCDTLLNLGFVYNGSATDIEYAKINLPPPAVGLVVLGGPLVPGDSGIVDLRRIYGKKNLGFTSFAHHTTNTGNVSPPYGDYPTGTGQRWNMIRGFRQVGGFDDPPQFYPFPPGTPQSPFPFSGDPFSQTGFLDGLSTVYSYPPSDPRIFVNSGPFRMAPDDTSEFTLAFVAGLGNDRLSSVKTMKQYAQMCRMEYQSLFSGVVPRTIVSTQPSPNNTTLTVRAQARSSIQNVTAEVEQDIDPGTTSIPITLYDDGIHSDSAAGDHIWGNTVSFPNARTPQRVNVTTHDADGEKAFEKIVSGVVLRPAPVLTNLRVVWEDGRQDHAINKGEHVRIAFDVQNPDSANPAGQIKIRDLMGAGSIDLSGEIPPGGTASSDPQSFFFFVSDQDSILHLEWELEFDGNRAFQKSDIPVTPWSAPPAWKDILSVSSIRGDSSRIAAIVADPLMLTGHQYLITFHGTVDSTLWDVWDKTAGTHLLTDQQAAKDSTDAFPIVDGIMLRVLRESTGFTDFRHVAGPGGSITPATYAGWSSFNGWGFPDPSGQGSPVADWGGGTWGIHAGGATDYSYGGFFSRVVRNDNASRLLPYDYEIRFTAAGGKACLYYTSGVFIDVPFELWNIGADTPNDPSDDFRMIPWINDADNNGQFNLEKLDHGLSAEDNDPYTDWIYWLDPNPKSPGTAGYQTFVAAANNYDGGETGAYPGTGKEVMARMVLVNLNGGSVSAPDWPNNVTLMPATGNVIRIVSSKWNLPGDSLLIQAPLATDVSGGQARVLSFELGQNYPNPFNPTTTIRFSVPSRSHVTLTIFNLLGQVVAQLVNEDVGAGFHKADWHAKVASGVYLYRLEATSLDGAGKNFRDVKKMVILK